jgi:hypothetical protein
MYEGVETKSAEWVASSCGYTNDSALNTLFSVLKFVF